MMLLPTLPQKIKKIEKQSLRFGGLDLTSGAAEGQLTDSFGISAEGFPALTVCGGREKLTEYRSPVDMYAAGGKLAVVDGDELHYDGKVLCRVAEGKKQFAVVGGKLCIYPDKIAVDIKDGTLNRLEKSMTFDTDHNTTVITSNSITVTPVRQKIQTGAEQEFDRTGLSGAFAYTCMYTYGSDRDAVESCFSGGMWQGLDRLESLKDVCYNNTGNHLSTGDIIIPELTEDGAFKLIGEPYKLIRQQEKNVIDPQYYPDKSRYNREGYYCVVTAVDTDLDRGADTLVEFSVYKTDGADVLMHGVFDLGDGVSIEGTPFGIKDTQDIPIREIDTLTNSLIFDEDSIVECEHYCILPAMAGANKPLTLIAGGRYVTITPPEALFAGTLLYMGGVYTGDTGTTQTRSITVYQWDPNTHHRVAAFDANVTGSYIEGAVQTEVYPKAFGALTVRRPLPDLDYICESGNRLWGVNCSENRVYCSHLGVPDSFYPDGKQGGWSMIFGSEGEFTAVCAFGGGVCCFKENRLHKILGSTPSQFYVNDYAVQGVQKGCERSVQTVNDTLYYKGVHGVYAYSGDVPKLISKELCSALPRQAAAGTDGRTYYLSGQAGGEGVRYAYDMHGKLWIKEASEQTWAFACIDGEMYMLTEDGVYRTGLSDKSCTDFMAEFVPFCEDSLHKKNYTRLVFGVEMAKDSTLRVYTRADGGDYRLTYTQVADSRCTLTVPVRIQRCSRFGVRLEGRGEIAVRSLMREFALLSEV